MQFQKAMAFISMVLKKSDGRPVYMNKDGNISPRAPDVGKILIDRRNPFNLVPTNTRSVGSI